MYEISKIVLFDSSTKSKSMLEKVFKESNFDFNIVHISKFKNLQKYLKENTCEILMINTDSKKNDAYKILRSITEKFPDIGKIAFSFGLVDIYKDGEKLIADAIIQKFGTHLNQLVYAIEFAFDRSTERKELKTINTEFQELFNNVPIGIYKIDLNGKIITCNKFFAELLGYESEKELINTKIQDFFATYVVQDSILQTFSINLPYQKGKIRLKKKDKTEIVAEIDTQATYSDNNILCYLTGTVKDISEEIELQNEVKRQNIKINQYLDSAETYFSVINTEGDIIFANEKLARYYDLSKEEIIGKNWLKMAISDELTPIVSANFKEMLRGNIGKNQFIEIAGKNSSGETRFFIWRNSVIHDREGNVDVIISSGTDITERKKVEEQLISSENKYRSLVETSLDAIAVHDLNGKMLFANKQLVSKHKYANLEAVLNLDIFDLIFENDHESYKKSIDEVLLKGSIDEIELQLLKKDGSTFTSEIRSSILVDNTEKPYAVMSVGKDISQRKKAEKAVKESERLYRAIFENTGTSMLVINEKNEIIICNTFFEKFLGLPKNEIEGTSWIPLVYENDLELLMEVSKDIKYSSNSFPKEIEFRVRGLEGNIHNVWAVIDIIPETSNAVVSLHDITQSKLMDEVRKQTYEQIERNMEQFAILVDSIRNPLAIIVGLADSQNSELSQKIIDQAEEIDKIISQLDQRWLESINVRNFLKEHMSM